MSQHPRPLPPSSNPLQILRLFSKTLNSMVFVPQLFGLKYSSIFSNPLKPFSSPPYNPPQVLPQVFPRALPQALQAAAGVLRTSHPHPRHVTNGFFPPDDSTYFKVPTPYHRRVVSGSQASRVCRLLFFQSIDGVKEQRDTGGVEGYRMRAVQTLIGKEMAAYYAPRAHSGVRTCSGIGYLFMLPDLILASWRLWQVWCQGCQTENIFLMAHITRSLELVLSIGWMNKILTLGCLNDIDPFSDHTVAKVTTTYEIW
ncbi:hypothetical protein B0H11DRAFT_2206371 [Mycena galericulata]|nr:hypothetical protein B0H11DRAFT_2206371 [Mycena galericulata]